MKENRSRFDIAIDVLFLIVISFLIVYMYYIINFYPEKEKCNDQVEIQEVQKGLRCPCEDSIHLFQPFVYED